MRAAGLSVADCGERPLFQATLFDAMAFGANVCPPKIREAARPLTLRGEK